MKKYLVGGAVRDMLLGKEPHDKDYVIVGSSIEEMISLGYKQVGKDFPELENFSGEKLGERYRELCIEKIRKELKNEKRNV